MKYEIVFIENGTLSRLFCTDNKALAATKYNQAICSGVYVRLRINGEILKILEADRVMDQSDQRKRWLHSVRVGRRGETILE